MNTNQRPKCLLLAITVALATGLIPLKGWAHCDTLDGPVVADAKLAIEKGDVAPVLKWVKKADEQRIRSAFDRTMKVRKAGEAARKLADQFFFETLVRIHRASEGAAYTGLKPAGKIDPVIRLADAALESGSVDSLSAKLQKAVDEGIRARFEAARQKGEHASRSVPRGREYVKAYVDYVHFIEGLHNQIEHAGHHGGPAPGSQPGDQSPQH